MSMLTAVCRRAILIFTCLKDESELTGIGWEEYLDGETVLIVEWANLVSGKRFRKKPHGCCWNMKEAACAACLWPLRNETD